jgi:hypothetical protein
MSRETPVVKLRHLIPHINILHLLTALYYRGDRPHPTTGGDAIDNPTTIAIAIGKICRFGKSEKLVVCISTIAFYTCRQVSFYRKNWWFALQRKLFALADSVILQDIERCQWYCALTVDGDNIFLVNKMH